MSVLKRGASWRAEIKSDRIAPLPNEINQRLGVKPFVTASPKLHATSQ